VYKARALKQETAWNAVNSWSTLLGCRSAASKGGDATCSAASKGGDASVALLPKVVMLPGRDASLSEDDADRAAFLIFWSLFRCSQDATLIAGMCVSLSVSHCYDIRARCPSHRSLVRFRLVTFSQCRFSYSS
jgi:hypothetical protein